MPEISFAPVVDTTRSKYVRLRPQGVNDVRLTDRFWMRSVAITAIPYHLWANRDPGPMQVWLPKAEERR